MYRHARALAQLIKDRPKQTSYLYHINLLPYNEARDVSTAFKRCEDWNQFQSILTNEGITTSFRNSFGRSIDAACGQLYATYEAKNALKRKPA
ncbi:hypothetical protein Pmar_PMAR024230 [Perkinsus marinus ATCC 50983]|uniref:Uncharacterized protein n=1 Tax=Perkinsus marinus (strain ATCC 50983 / TXsc) TaxID=423536 RepID=C5K6S8_PERM5|nr:hypothetical protein Pmar_PMAR024230 [Perkinsus marinus ATCC 50983]EER19814.1 hypothetical protein Pmar_PMAR024230 [Perkinsus marinus ATCC 50983]|eukprot:XP_002788018.1 hypothetical protein Pmar_PMAR024230 [Perkinsus marinus ATCC 50983]